MKRMRWHRRSLGAGLCLLGVAANAPGLVALRSIEVGQWQLNEASGTGNRSLCVADAGALIQLRHGPTQCSQLVIESTPTRATVHYSCPGAGYGHTVITVETPRLIHVQTQGVADGQPFSLDYEGRRTGACGVAAHRS